MIFVRDFKRRDFDRPQTMFKTICSDCGKECEVPFKPSGNKPVFCRDCFQSKRTDNPPRRPNFDDRGPHHPAPEPHKEQFDALNAKLDKILNLLTVKEPVEEVKVEVPAVKSPVVKKKKVAKK
jgi:CxxC-x17-CxxC domain-containing protein